MHKNAIFPLILSNFSKFKNLVTNFDSHFIELYHKLNKNMKILQSQINNQCQ